MVQPSSLAVLAVVNGSNIDIQIGGVEGLVGGAVSAFFTVLVLGAILVAVFPGYTNGRIEDVLSDPVSALVYGIFSLVALVVLVVVLVITLVGIFVAIPLVVVAYVLWAVGATVAFLAIADRLIGHDDGWTKPILLAALLSGGLALTGVGGLLSLLLGAVGFGAVLRHLLS